MSYETACAVHHSIQAPSYCNQCAKYCRPISMPGKASSARWLRNFIGEHMAFLNILTPCHQFRGDDKTRFCTMAISHHMCQNTCSMQWSTEALNIYSPYGVNDSQALIVVGQHDSRTHSSTHAPSRRYNATDPKRTPCISPGVTCDTKKGTCSPHFLLTLDKAVKHLLVPGSTAWLI